MTIDPPEGRQHRYGREQSMVPVLSSVHRESLIGLVRLACFGESIVNAMPCSARISRVSRSTAVSGSHIPSGRRLNRKIKSCIPHTTCVRLSLWLARGIIIWLYTCAIADPCPENRLMLSLSAFRMAEYTSGWLRSSQVSRVGPKLKLIRE